MGHLVRRDRVEPDPEARNALYAVISEWLRQDLPVLWLCPQVATGVAHRQVRGLRSPDRVNPILELPHLWLDEER